MSGDQVHTFAIGDVHGCGTLLEELLLSIRTKARRGGFPFRIVFLGDIIDRGPYSRWSMEQVVRTLDEVPGSKLILGNHESLLLRAIDGEDHDVRRWLEAGGDTALVSYGHPAEQPVTAEAIRSAIGEEHISCMRNAERYVELDKHFLVHAGLRPGIPLGEQDPYDLIWIREGFLDYCGTFEKMVVHGHTPTLRDDVELWEHRLAVDTYAYGSGVLSAVHISPTGEVSAIQAISQCDGMFCNTMEMMPLEMNWTRAYAIRALQAA